MKVNDLDAIMDRLTHIREHKKQIDLTKAQAEIRTIQRETEAYWDGMYDFMKAVKALMPVEKDGVDNA